jgi:hypothetical protein
VPRPERTRRYNCSGDCAHGTDPISKPSRRRPGPADQPDKSRLRLVLLVPADAWASAAASGVEPPSHALLAVSDVPGDSASPFAANPVRISSTFPADPGVAARLSRAELAQRHEGGLRVHEESASASRVAAPSAFKVVLAGQGALNYWARWASYFVSLRPKEGLPLPCHCASPFYLAALQRPRLSEKCAAGPLHQHPPPRQLPCNRHRHVRSRRHDPHPVPVPHSAAGDGYACSRAPRARTECPSSRTSSGRKTARAPAPRWASMRPPSRSRSRAGRSRGRAKRSPPTRSRS